MPSEGSWLHAAAAESWEEENAERTHPWRLEKRVNQQEGSEQKEPRDQVSGKSGYRYRSTEHHHRHIASAGHTSDITHPQQVTWP